MNGEIGHGGKQMAGDMTAQVAVERLPTTQSEPGIVATLQGGVDSRRIAERVQQTVDGDRGYPSRVALHVTLEARGQQPHVT